MRRLIALVASLALATSIPMSAEGPGLSSEDDKTLYALGLALSQRLGPFGLEADEVSWIEAGLRDGILGHEPKVDLLAYGPRIDGYLEARLAEIADRERAAGKQFLEATLEEPGATKLASGAVYFEEEAGTGTAATPESRVRVHYQGTFRDGTVFDSSVAAGEPAEFAVNAVVPCFSEGIQRMRVGGKARLVCPPEAAYGDAGFPPMIGPGTTLIFQLELIEIVEQAPSETEP